MRRVKLVLLAAGATLAVVSATAFALGAPNAQAGFGPGRVLRPYGGTGPTPTPTPPLCLQSYPVVVANSPSPSNGQADDQLNGIAAISATNIWAVGSTNNNAQPLIEHDNGSAWSVVASPTLSNTYSNVLYGVAAVSANDIWAVGETTPINPPYNASQPLIEHWNGAAWSLVASPTIPGTYDGFSMRAVKALASNDVWAVGDEYSTSSASDLLVEHWNGSQWSVIPDPTTGVGLHSLAVLSDTNVWAVGVGLGSSAAVNSTTLIEHYDGTSWSVMSSPSPGTWWNYLTGVVAVSPTNIWAVGYWSNYDEEPYQNETLVEHWNGTAWSVVASPNPGQMNDVFQAVGIDSGGNLWVVGAYQGNSGPELALVERFGQIVGGTTWTQEAAQPGDPEGDNNFHLNALAVISQVSVWFAGRDYGNGSFFRTVVEQYRLRPATVCPNLP